MAEESWWDKYGASAVAVGGDLAQGYMNQQGSRAEEDMYRRQQQNYESSGQAAIAITGSHRGGSYIETVPLLRLLVESKSCIKRY